MVRLLNYNMFRLVDRCCIAPQTNPFIISHLNRQCRRATTTEATATHSIKPRDNLSIVQGPTHPSLLHGSVTKVFNERAHQFKDRVALICPGEGDLKWTYGELQRRVSVVAHNLKVKLGIERGDRVGLLLPNCSAWLTLQYAVARAGAIVVCFNPGYRAEELAASVKLSGVKCLVGVPRLKGSDYVAMLEQEELLPELKQEKLPNRFEKFPHLRHIVMVDLEGSGGGGANLPRWATDYRGLEEQSHDYNSSPATTSAATGWDEPESEELEVANIQFTSGTTGTAKGVSLNHHSIINNGRLVGLGQELEAGDVVCVPVPLYHCFGLVMGNLACLTAGATLLYPSPTFDPLLTLTHAAAHRATSLYGVPTMFHTMLDHPRFREFDLKSLRTGIMAGAPCPAPTMERVINEMNMRGVTICYGMTETSPVSFMTQPDATLSQRTTTVGKVMPHTLAKIVQPDDDDKGKSEGGGAHAAAVVPINTTGTLLVKGFLTMRGYWGNPEATRAVLNSDGWMDTGDLARLDGDGNLQIVGRTKDMVIRGGENLFPAEIEAVLLRCPGGVVGQVAVVGVPDDKYGEELCAFLISPNPDTSSSSSSDNQNQPTAAPDATVATLRKFLKSKLAHYKVPKYFLQVPQFPKTTTGKIQKHILREMATEHLRSPSSPQ